MLQSGLKSSALNADPCLLLLPHEWRELIWRAWFPFWIHGFLLHVVSLFLCLSATRWFQIPEEQHGACAPRERLPKITFVHCVSCSAQWDRNDISGQRGQCHPERILAFTPLGVCMTMWGHLYRVMGNYAAAFREGDALSRVRRPGLAVDIPGGTEARRSLRAEEMNRGLPGVGGAPCRPVCFWIGSLCTLVGFSFLHPRYSIVSSLGVAHGIIQN